MALNPAIMQALQNMQPAANNMINRLQPPTSGMQPVRGGMPPVQVGQPPMMPPAQGAPGMVPAPGPGQIQAPMVPVAPGLPQQGPANLQPGNYNNAMLMRLQAMRQPQMMGSYNSA